MSNKAKIAIATGDPAGIGPEISLRAALDPAVRNACRPIVVGNLGVVERHARACGLKVELAAEGEDNDAIAQTLTLSVRTIERHFHNIYAKLGVHGKAARTAAVSRLLTRA